MLAMRKRIPNRVSRAAPRAPVINGIHDIAPVNDLTVTDQWRLVTQPGIVRPDHIELDTVFPGILINLSVKPARTAMHPNRIPRDLVEVGGFGFTVTVACERDSHQYQYTA